MLNVANLEVGYGQSTVIRDLNFSLEKNQTIAIMVREIAIGQTEWLSARKALFKDMTHLHV